MRKLSCIIIAFLFFSMTFQVHAQWNEAGILIGGANYVGDLSPNGMAPEEYNLAFGIFGRYNLNKYVSFKGHFNKAKISGDDANNSYVDGLRQRNLSFRSNILEVGIVNEFNLTPYDPRDEKSAVPYIFAGVSLFYYNPQAEFKGGWFDLRPLGTEGQGNLMNMEPYSTIGFSVPFGMGFKWNLSHLVNIGAEFGMRMAVTDYLDDVSGRYPDVDQLSMQDPLAGTLSFRSPEFMVEEMENPIGTFRGDPSTNDWYFIGGITMSVNLTDKYGMEWDPQFKSFSKDVREPWIKKKSKEEKNRNKLKRKAKKIEILEPMDH